MNDQQNYYQSSRLEVTHLLPKEYERVLEIGCAEGNFRANLKRKCECWGIEPVKAAAKIASQKLDKVLIGTYDDVFDELPEDFFDLVICNDVIFQNTSI